MSDTTPAMTAEDAARVEAFRVGGYTGDVTHDFGEWADLIPEDAIDEAAEPGEAGMEA